jgi:hypothetical protein
MSKWMLAGLIAVLCAGVVLAQDAPEEKPTDSPVEAEDENIVTLRGGGKFYVEEKRIEIPGEILMARGLIELFACSEGGKDHESIMRLDVLAEDLNLALIMMELEPGTPPESLEEAKASDGDRVIIEVKIEGENPKTLRAEELIWNKAYDEPMEQVGFVYVGSAFIDEIDIDTGKPTGRRIFLASQNKSLITTYRDHTTLLDNPLPWGANDNLYYVNEEVIPEIGTKITAIIRIPTAEELKAMKAAEAAALKRATEGGMPDVAGEGRPGQGSIREDDSDDDHADDDDDHDDEKSDD